MSDAAVRDATGRGRDDWFRLLDTWGATTRSHAEIAAWLVDHHNVPAWWAQNLTVGYEQARGTRVVGQTSEGVFVASASKTVNVAAARAYAAFANPELRQRWLPGVDLRIRSGSPGTSLRATWDDGQSRVNVYFTAKAEAKTRVAIQDERLPDADAVAARKAFWRERLTDLKNLLEG